MATVKASALPMLWPSQAEGPQLTAVSSQILSAQVVPSAFQPTIGLAGPSAFLVSSTSATQILLFSGDSIRSACADGDMDSFQCGAKVEQFGAADPTGVVVEMSGTSMATPTCAGAAAIVRQYFAEGYHVSGSKNTAVGKNISSAMVKAMMIQSGQAMWFEESSGSWVLPERMPALSQGFGRLDLSRVLWFGQESDFKLHSLDREVAVPSEYNMYCFTVAPGKPFRATVVWTDPEGPTGSGRTLIHNLDLSVQTPSGDFLYGNDLVDSNGAALIDEINNV